MLWKAHGYWATGHHLLVCRLVVSIANPNIVRSVGVHKIHLPQPKSYGLRAELFIRSAEALKLCSYKPLDATVLISLRTGFDFCAKGLCLVVTPGPTFGSR
jgi:hypothetical protein